MLFLSLLQSLRRSAARSQEGLACHQKTQRGRARQRRPFVPRLETLEDRTVPSTLTVLNNADSGMGSLRATIAAASSGDTIVFANSLKNKTITLTSGELAFSKSLDIEGLGAKKLTISGNDASRVFDITGSGTVTIAGLTITDGLATTGGGILNGSGATLSISNCTLTNNEALEMGLVGGNGGAIEDLQGALSVANCSFENNKATDDGSGSSTNVFAVGGRGGAIDVGFDNPAPTRISNSTFTGNQALAVAQSSGAGAAALGGAVSDDNSHAGSSLTITGCTFAGNVAVGATGGPADGGGPAAGGAVWIFSSNPVAISDSTFTQNQARGGSGANAAGGGIFANGPTASTTTVTDCAFTYNAAIGAPGADAVNSFGFGIGGGICSGSGVGYDLIVRNSTLTGNLAIGAPLAPNVIPPPGPVTALFLESAGGGIEAEGPLTITNTTLIANEVIGGAGTPNSPGIVGAGGGIDIYGAYSDSVVGCTLDHNLAVGGAGGPGTAGGAGVGGGINLGGGASLTVSNTVLDHNQAIGGAGGAGAKGGDGIAGGLGVGINVVFGFPSDPSSLTLINSTLDHNEAIGGAGGSGGSGGDGWGGGLVALAGCSATVSNTDLEHNQAVGGDGSEGGNGGNGFGGGIYIASGASVSVTGSSITHNRAQGGEGDDGGSDGLGIGGGVYNLGSFTFDVFTVIKKNDASTSNDDIFP